jgi:hypothetical protein
MPAMKLQRLAGYGPTAAYLSALALFVFFFVLILGYPISQAAPGLGTVLSIIWFFSLWVWIAAFAVVVFDLEWLEHPSTSTRWFQIAHWATLVAVFVPILLGISLILNFGFLGALCVLVIGVCVGISLLVHNLDARRAGLLKGNLPWVGVVAGVAFILAAIGIAISLPPLGFTALILGQTFYIAWAIWLGMKLGGAKTATPAPASATR